jgi:hypothetical protein
MKINYDKIGLITSSACAVHCVVLPFLITALPYIGLSFFLDTFFEIILFSISAILAFMSICFGYRIHKNKNLTFSFAFGLLLLVSGHLMHESKWSANSFIPLGIGGILIASSHFINNKLCKSCSECSVGAKNV